MADTLIALGANLAGEPSGANENKQATLQAAVECLTEHPQVKLTALSSMIVTVPVGVPDQPEQFVNGAARFEVGLSPQQWLELLLETEQRLGRERKVRWGARRIDLDLLLYDEEVVHSDPLHVPHPRMSFRRFVMQPAAEIGASMWHPNYGTTLGSLWDFLNRRLNVVNWFCLSDDDRTLAEKWTPVSRVEKRFIGSATASADNVSSVHEGSTVLTYPDWLSETPIQGAEARALVLIHSQPTSLVYGDCKLLIERRDNGNEFQSRVRRESAVEFDGPLRLVLRQEDAERTLQEVNGAIDSMLQL